MKKLFFFSIFFSLFVNAQLQEEMKDDQYFSEGGKNAFRLDIKRPFSLTKAYACRKTDFAKNFTRATFPGGEEVFSKELFKNASAYLDREAYSLNGTFYLTFDVDTTGKMKNILVEPKVQNSEMFFVDLKFSLLRIKTPWIPATCNGNPVVSKMKIKLKFTTENFDL